MTECNLMAEVALRLRLANGVTKLLTSLTSLPGGLGWLATPTCPRCRTRGLETGQTAQDVGRGWWLLSTYYRCDTCFHVWEELWISDSVW